MCYLNRTYHVLPTATNGVLDISAFRCVSLCRFGETKDEADLSFSSEGASLRRFPRYRICVLKGDALRVAVWRWHRTRTFVRTLGDLYKNLDGVFAGSQRKPAPKENDG